MVLNNEQNPFEKVVTTLNKIIGDKEKILGANNVTEESFFFKKNKSIETRLYEAFCVI